MENIDTTPSKINLTVETKSRTIKVTLAYFFFAIGFIAGIVALAISFFGI